MKAVRMEMIGCDCGFSEDLCCCCCCCRLIKMMKRETFWRGGESLCLFSSSDSRSVVSIVKTLLGKQCYIIAIVMRMITRVSLDGRCSLPPVCAVDSNVFVSLTKGLISPLARLHSHSQVFTSLFFQTLTEVRALRFPEVFSKNNVQEVSGCLLPPSGCQRKLRLNPDSCLSREQAQKKKNGTQPELLCSPSTTKWFTAWVKPAKMIHLGCIVDYLAPKSTIK